jgi:hypothetical protein
MGYDNSYAEVEPYNNDLSANCVNSCNCFVWFITSQIKFKPQALFSYSIYFFYILFLGKVKFRGKRYCPTKTNRGLEWYLSKAYDLLISRLVFFFKFKEPWPFKFN